MLDPALASCGELPKARQPVASPSEREREVANSSELSRNLGASCGEENWKPKAAAQDRYGTFERRNAILDSHTTEYVMVIQLALFFKERTRAT